MWWIILAGALHNFNMYALGQFLSPYLIRYHGLDTAEAGVVAGICYGFSGGIGVLIGGWLCDRMAHRRIGGRLEVSAIALLISVPCLYFSLQSPPGAVWHFAGWLLPACLVSYIFYSGVYPTIQDIVEPALRGTAMAVFFCAMYVLGASLGPLATGSASDHYARRAAEADGSAKVLDWHKAIGLHDAMSLIPALGLVLVVVLFLASRTVPRDHARLQAWMQSNSP
jgi:MFS family permease